MLFHARSSYCCCIAHMEFFFFSFIACGDKGKLSAVTKVDSYYPEHGIVGRQAGDACLTQNMKTHSWFTTWNFTKEHKTRKLSCLGVISLFNTRLQSMDKEDSGIIAKSEATYSMVGVAWKDDKSKQKHFVVSKKWENKHLIFHCVFLDVANTTCWGQNTNIIPSYRELAAMHKLSIESSPSRIIIGSPRSAAVEGFSFHLFTCRWFLLLDIL